MKIVKNNKNQIFIEAESIYAEMKTLEEINGVTTKRITDNWYTIKREIINALTTTPEEDTKSEKEQDEQKNTSINNN